ncbi:hypothetical protein [Burkholderia seminalis]|uniref:hypothetical protein n=1 Tax=Burkholderia seminalis TaxID=488731 RepID=UPI000AE1DA0F|nr:hypothetical protein [Burkholderia seminalis]MBJ9595446.1 hypothetical protein [Burkholderia seminalis]MCA8430131.1 hypothetical protein [Burkholderia seminalis]RQS85352.1 hypothetical protein DF048_34655 [Burkholderia seminalis]VWB13488.1 GntR family transcriptional regulator [Burkholderia seminalis]
MRDSTGTIFSGCLAERRGGCHDGDIETGKTEVSAGWRDAIGAVPGIESRDKRLVTRAEADESVGIVKEAADEVAERNMSALA